MPHTVLAVCRHSMRRPVLWLAGGAIEHHGLQLRDSAGLAPASPNPTLEPSENSQTALVKQPNVAFDYSL